MSFIDHLLTYYRGEKTEAILLFVSGLVTVIASIIIYQQISQNQLIKGLFYPVLFLGLFTLCAGAFNTYSNTQRLSNFPVEFQSNQKEFVQKEIQRFEGLNGVNKWWLPLKITWSIFLLVGFVLTFTTKNDLVNGIAIGLMVIGVMGFVIDGFAHQRAKIYTDILVNQKI